MSALKDKSNVTELNCGALPLSVFHSPSGEGLILESEPEMFASKIQF